jgi:uncharacterized protein (TIGR02466 family)
MIIPLFPTNVYKKTIEGDWNREQILTRLDQYFAEQLETKQVVRDIHKEKVFEPLVKYMNQAVAEYWKVLDYDPRYPVEINQMWANLYNRNAEYPHNLDNDSPAVVTVVFYVSKDSAEQGNLFFADPNDLIVKTQPLSPERRYINRYQEFDGRTGDMICFPSWLQHGIKPNETDIPRLSIAANYELRGLAMVKKVMGRQ